MAKRRSESRHPPGVAGHASQHAATPLKGMHHTFFFLPPPPTVESSGVPSQGVGEGDETKESRGEGDGVIQPGAEREELDLRDSGGFFGVMRGREEELHQLDGARCCMDDAAIPFCSGCGKQDSCTCVTLSSGGSTGLWGAPLGLRVTSSGFENNGGTARCGGLAVWVTVSGLPSSCEGVCEMTGVAGIGAEDGWGGDAGFEGSVGHTWFCTVDT